MIYRIAKFFTILFLLPLIAYSQNLIETIPIFEPDRYIGGIYKLSNYGVSPNYEYAFISGMQNTGKYEVVYYVYDLKHGKLHHIFYDTKYNFSNVGSFFSSDSQYLYLFGWDNNDHSLLLKWNIQSKSFESVVELEKDHKGSIVKAVTLGEDLLVTLQITNSLSIPSKAFTCRSMSSGQIVWKQEFEKEDVYSIDKTVDGIISLHGFLDNSNQYKYKVCLWDSKGDLIKSLSCPDNVIPTTASEIINMGDDALISHVHTKSQLTECSIGLINLTDGTTKSKIGNLNFESCISVSPNKKRIAYITENNTIRYISTDASNNLQLDGEFDLDVSMSDSKQFLKCFFTGDSKITYLSGMIVKELNIKDNSTRCLSLPNGSIKNITYFNDDPNRFVVMISTNNTVDYNIILIYDLEDKDIISYWEWEKFSGIEEHNNITLSRNDQYIAIPTKSNEVTIVNTDDMSLYKTLKVENTVSIINSAFYTENILAVSCSDSTVRVVNLKNGSEIERLSAGHTVDYMKFIDMDFMLLTYKSKNGWAYQQCAFDEPVNSIWDYCGKNHSLTCRPFDFNENDQYIYYATTYEVRKVRINDYTDRETLFESNNEYNTVRNSKDNKYFLFRNNERRLRLFEKSTLNQVMELKDYIPYQDGFENSSSIADISSDNKKIAMKELTPAVLVFNISHFTSVYEENTNPDSRMIVYPVPVTNNELTIDLNHSSFMCNRIALYNTLGQEVQSWDNIQYPPKSLTLTLDMHLSNGVYYLVLSNNKIKQVKQIVINRK